MKNEQYPKAFIKWVGGKQKILSHLENKIPFFFQTYHEPMLGGGSLFFLLSKKDLIKNAFLSDTNLRLVRTYQALKDDVEGVIDLLKTYPYDPEFFQGMREKVPEDLTDIETAAWFLYLNRSGFNGLYRVNKSNKFNVPFGKYKAPKICNSELLRAASEALQKAEIEHAPVEVVLERANPGDFVYFDPPYIPRSVTSNFTSYTAEGFGHEDHVALRDLFAKLKEKRVFTLLSNSWTDITLDLYKGHQIEQIPVRRVVSATQEGRELICEALIS